MSSRSNSARAAIIPKMSLPDAVVVSMAAPCPVRTLSPMPFCEIVDDVDQVAQVSAQPVQLPHEQGCRRAAGP
jgi:hypothetical protein